MEFVPYRARLPEGARFLSGLDAAAGRLLGKLQSIDVESLGISEYIARYLGQHIARLPYSLQKDCYILLLSTAWGELPLDELVFLDYGGGSGTLSMLAKELGIGTVIYADIYDVSCRDAAVIAESLGNKADYYVCGEIDEVHDFVEAKGVDCNAVASCNVIEHIYDIEGFLGKFHLLSGGSLTLALSSTANKFNPIRRLQLMREQREREYSDREAGWGHKERDCLESFFDVRRRMILKNLGELDRRLSDKEVERLARNTRGRIEPEIVQCVNVYLQTGEMPPAPHHPTNTCDPYTGNWAEHLMDPYDLVDILAETGFEARVSSGYYASGQVAVRALGGIINPLINLLGTRGLYLAPSFILLARKRLQ